MNTPTNTPRTDAAEKEANRLGDELCVRADLARQLERELGEARQQLEDMRDKMLEYKSAHDYRESDLATLRAEKEKLREALAPFDGLMDWAGITDSDADTDAFMTGSQNAIQEICGVRTKVVTVGDLRRARSVFNSTKPTP